MRVPAKSTRCSQPSSTTPMGARPIRPPRGCCRAVYVARWNSAASTRQDGAAKVLGATRKSMPYISRLSATLQKNPIRMKYRSPSIRKSREVPPPRTRAFSNRVQGATSCKMPVGSKRSKLIPPQRCLHHTTWGEEASRELCPREPRSQSGKACKAIVNGAAGEGVFITEAQSTRGLEK
jgi:hypothetical protein